MNRRILALTLAGALSVTLLAGCASQNNAAPETTDPVIESSSPAPESTSPLPESSAPLPESSQPQPEDSQSPAQPEESEPASSPSAKPSQSPSSKPSQSPAPSTKPSQSPSQSPAPAPSETPESSPETSVVTSVWNDIAKLDLPNLMDVDADTLSALYGIDSADLVEFVCKMPMMNVKATEFFIAQVADGRMDAVKAALEARQADLEAQWSQYLPDQLELVQNYQLVTNGNYVIFAVSEYAADAVDIFNTYTK